MFATRFLINVANVNSFDWSDRPVFCAGTAYNIYFQVVDKSKDPYLLGFVPSGRRYVPASGATMEVTLKDMDSAKQIVDRVAVQPFPNDPSIWMVSVLSTDSIKGTINMTYRLTEGASVRYGSSEAAISVLEV